MYNTLPTFGIEEELLVIDAQSSRSTPARRLLTPSRADLVPELNDCCIEWNSPVCTSADELEAAAVDVRRELVSRGEPIGLRVLGVGMHPRDDRGVGISPGAHYDDIARRFPWAARNEVSYGMHVHVGMPSLDDAVRVSDAMRPLLPLLAAVGANSAMRGMRGSGARSLRLLTSRLFPRTGAPPVFGDAAGLRAYLDELQRTGVIANDTECWWLVRPHTKWGTMELRLFDAQADPRRSVQVACLARLLAQVALDRGEVLPQVSDEVLEEEIVAAAREGWSAPLLRDGFRGQTVHRVLSELVSPLLADHPDGARIGELLASGDPSLVRPASRLDPISEVDVARFVRGAGAAGNAWATPSRRSARGLALA